MDDGPQRPPSSIVRTDQDQDCTDDLRPPTIFTKAEMKTRIMLNTPTRVLLVRDWTIFLETVCIAAGNSCSGERWVGKKDLHKGQTVVELSAGRTGCVCVCLPWCTNIWHRWKGCWQVWWRCWCKFPAWPGCCEENPETRLVRHFPAGEWDRRVFPACNQKQNFIDGWQESRAACCLAQAQGRRLSVIIRAYILHKNCKIKDINVT